MRIFKYVFDIGDYIKIAMPVGAKILHVAMQQGDPCLWALVNPDHSVETRQFRIFGTGHPIDEPESLVHIATFQQPPFVWHLFEVK